MARPRQLNDVKLVKDSIDDYLSHVKYPTLTGVSRILGIHPDTLYRNIDREDDIGDLLLDVYLRIVEAHETGLWDRSCAGHIFFLKCLKKHITFRENDNPNDAPSKPTEFTFKILEKEKDKDNESNISK